MREAGGIFRQQTDVRQRLLHALLAFFRRDAFDVVKTFGDDIIHLSALVERSHGVLEDHLDFAGDFVVQLFGNFAVDLLAVVNDFAPRCWMDADDGAADGGLARTGFTDQTEGFALIDIKRDAVDSGKETALAAEADLEVLHMQQNFFLFVIHAR